jgi:hypothetical protein
MKRTFGMVLVAVAALTVDAFAQEYSRSLLPYRAGCCEPGQVRKEAAVSKCLRVPQECLI